MTLRRESDSFGVVDIPSDRYWGAQTQRALAVFDVPGPTMPPAVIRAFGMQKAAAARANMALGRLLPEIGAQILAAADEMRRGRFDDHFPLPVWQTGSGTQTNMTANEVIANRANELAGEPLGTRSPVHPNDQVNLSQSSNDSFPTVMHVAAVLSVEGGLLPAIGALHAGLKAKAVDFADQVRLGRTHLNDAVPVTLGQGFASYARQIERAGARAAGTLPDLRALPQGGTAAGSGLNAPDGFDAAFCEAISHASGTAFHPNPIKVEGMAAHDALVATSAALEGLAIALIHILNDIRLLASGPRAGFGELLLPDDGLTSSIMPGKRNATLAEALIQICHRVIGNHATIGLAGASGLFELNVAKPVLIHALIESCEALTGGIGAFRRGCLDGLAPDRARMAHNVEMSLMAATALTPRLGYDRVAELTRLAKVEGLTLRETCLRSGLLTEAEYDAAIDPARMARGGVLSHKGDTS